MVESRPKDKILEEIMQYTKQIKGFPKSHSWLLYIDYNNRASHYSELGNYNQALKDLNKAINLVESKEKDSALIYPELYANRGVVLYQLQRYDKSINDLKKAVENLRSCKSEILRVESSMLLISSYLQLKKYRMALTNTDEAIKQKTNFLCRLEIPIEKRKMYESSLFFLRAISCIKLKEYDEGKEALKKAIEVSLDEELKRKAMTLVDIL